MNWRTGDRRTGEQLESRLTVNQGNAANTRVEANRVGVPAVTAFY